MAEGLPGHAGLSLPSGVSFASLESKLLEKHEGLLGHILPVLSCLGSRAQSRAPRAQGRAALSCGDCGLQRTRASDRGAHNHARRAVAGNVKAPVTEEATGRP